MCLCNPYIHNTIFLQCHSSPTGLSSLPGTPSSTVQRYGRDSVTLTVQWQPPQYDGGGQVNYTITVSPGFSPVTTSGTSVPVTVPYNVGHTISIVATNCNGSSSAAMETIRIGMLSSLSHCLVVRLTQKQTDYMYVGMTATSKLGKLL